MPNFEGFDHIDCRVTALAAVEPFYDQLMPHLGLPDKRFAYVDPGGEWHEISAEHPYNAVEYYEQPRAGHIPFFIGFIERPDHRPGLTRIAFRVDRARMAELGSKLAAMGARNVEPSPDEDYPAIFFEDPAGTKLEVIARAPAAA